MVAEGDRVSGGKVVVVVVVAVMVIAMLVIADSLGLLWQNLRIEWINDCDKC